MPAGSMFVTGRMMTFAGWGTLCMLREHALSRQAVGTLGCLLGGLGMNSCIT